MVKNFKASTGTALVQNIAEVLHNALKIERLLHYNRAVE